MQEKKLPVNVMISQMISELERVGYCTATIWGNFYVRFRIIEIYHSKKGSLYYDPDIAAEFLRLQKERFDRHEVERSYYSHMKTAVRRMNEFFMTGTFHVPPVRHGTRYVVNENNERLIAAFISWKNYGPNTRDDVLCALRRYFYFFEHLGYRRLLMQKSAI